MEKSLFAYSALALFAANDVLACIGPEIQIRYQNTKILSAEMSIDHDSFHFTSGGKSGSLDRKNGQWCLRLAGEEEVCKGLNSPRKDRVFTAGHLTLVIKDDDKVEITNLRTRVAHRVILENTVTPPVDHQYTQKMKLSLYKDQTFIGSFSENEIIGGFKVAGVENQPVVTDNVRWVADLKDGALIRKSTCGGEVGPDLGDIGTGGSIPEVPVVGGGSGGAY